MTGTVLPSIHHRSSPETVVVATSESQSSTLEKLARQAKATGVGDLERLNEAKVKQMKLNISPVSALYSRLTGILDSAALSG